MKYPVTAVIVAAGLSRRMGAFKLTLPWRGSTVIETVVATLARGQLAEIVVVTGHRGDEVAAALAGTAARCVPNPQYEAGGMLSSIQTGLGDIAVRHASAQTPGDDGGRPFAAAPQMAAKSQATAAPQLAAALVCLGDQPQMEAAAVEAVLAEGMRTGWQRVIIPSYRMRAGHPILIPSSLWPQIMNTTESLRSALRLRADLLTYLNVETDSILADLDTPEDYARATTPQGE